MQSRGDPRPLAEGPSGRMARAWVTAGRVGTGWWHRPGSLLNVSVTRCWAQGSFRGVSGGSSHPSKKVMCFDLLSRNRSSSGIRSTQPAPKNWAAPCFSTTAEDQGPLWAPRKGSRRRQLVHSAAQRWPGCSSTDTAVVESLGAYATKQRGENKTWVMLKREDPPQKKYTKKN